MDIRDLIKYIQSQREKGLSDVDIKNNLVVSGWEKDSVENAFKQLNSENYSLNKDILKSTKKYFLRGDYAFHKVEDSNSYFPKEKSRIGILFGIIGCLFLLLSIVNYGRPGLFWFAIISAIFGFLTYHKGSEMLGNIIFAVSIMIVLVAPLTNFMIQLMGIR